MTKYLISFPAEAMIVSDEQIAEADRIMRAAVEGMLNAAPAK